MSGPIGLDFDPQVAVRDELAIGQVTLVFMTFRGHRRRFYRALLSFDHERDLQSNGVFTTGDGACVLMMGWARSHVTLEVT